MQGPRAADRINCECTQGPCPPLWLLQCDYCQALISQNIRSMALEGKHVHRKTCIHMADTSLWPLWCIRHRSAQLRSLSGEVKGWSDTQTLPLLHKPTHIEAFPGEAGGLPGHVMCCSGAGKGAAVIPSFESRNQTWPLWILIPFLLPLMNSGGLSVL